ncbi:MAG: hypothetical protein VX325_06835 [Bacteroidota bacterium]|nr:hypothetical protein [Bacteroidota bacterium]
MKNNDLPKKDIPFEKFDSLDILIGQIISFKNIPNKNLLSFKVDVKKTVLNIVSRKSFKIDFKKIIGQKVVVLSNIKPFKIDGLSSDGIILIAKDKKGKASFIFPENQDVEIGSKIH